ncbi:MAG TPA: hypothetical protein VMW72_20610 [Sedimentisphaerales bacterium]|nr:hypothetical protein [Sedimentisphaerales bacterium]
MDIIDKMLSLKEILKTKIEHALKNSNTETIVSFAKDLDLIGRLEKQYREIETAVISLDQKVKLNIDTPQNTNKSNKQIGKEERIIFIQEAKEKGIILSEERGPLYKDNLGGLVGIPYASECKPDRWWLGLPNKKYQNIVLICKNESSERAYFIFPYTFCAKYQDKFGTDKKAKQIKFNVSLKNGIYTLLIPDSEPITINEYIDKFDNIPR